MDELRNGDLSLELKDEIGEDSSSDSDIQILEDDVDNVPVGQSFFIDVSGLEAGEVDAENESISYNLSNILSHFSETPDSNGKKQKGRRSGQACFNCDSTEHPARECPHPRDERRLSQNRNSFIKRRESGRLHEDAPREEITPGKISQKLRDALGIGDKDLPEWIYRMRALGDIEGYPPAYRKRATEKSVFKMHMGGTDQKLKNDTLTIDPRKIVKYPGFNYDDKEYKDQKCEAFQIWPMDEFIERQQSYLLQLDALKNMGSEGQQSSSPTRKRKFDSMDNGKTSEEIEEGYDSDVLVIDSTLEDGEIRENGQVIDSTNVTVRKRKKISTNTTSMEIQSTSSVDVEIKRKDYSNGIDGTQDPIPLDETWIPKGKHITDQLNHNVVKPSLESFARDILPFQHQQPHEGSTGFIKKLHSIVRAVKDDMEKTIEQKKK